MAFYAIITNSQNVIYMQKTHHNYYGYLKIAISLFVDT